MVRVMVAPGVNPDPVIVTTVPIGPELGERVIEGGPHGAPFTTTSTAFEA